VEAKPRGEGPEAVAGEKLTIPLNQTLRSDFSGATMQLRTMGAGFEGVPGFDVSLTADKSQAVLDLAALKTPPGDYVIAFLGSAVAKYRHHPEAIGIAGKDFRRPLGDQLRHFGRAPARFSELRDAGQQRVLPARIFVQAPEQQPFAQAPR